MARADSFFYVDQKVLKTRSAASLPIEKRPKGISLNPILDSSLRADFTTKRLFQLLDKGYRTTSNLTRSSRGMMTRRWERSGHFGWRDASYREMWLLWVSMTFPSPATSPRR